MSSNSKTVVSVKDIANVSISKWVVLMRSLRDHEVPEQVRTLQVVGYNRGLEPDKIIGATKRDGRLMFLMAWKNSVDGKTDLLEAAEVYKKSPQVAIEFFQERLCYFPHHE